MTICRMIAKCQCGQAYYDTPRGWAGMLKHVDFREDHTGSHAHKHQWLEVTDLVIMKKPGSTTIETKPGWT